MTRNVFSEHCQQTPVGYVLSIYLHRPSTRPWLVHSVVCRTEGDAEAAARKWRGENGSRVIGARHRPA